MRKLWTLLLSVVLVLSAAIAALAQDSHAVSFDGISFEFDEALARNVNIIQYPGDPAELGFGFSEPPYTQFNFYDEFPAPQSVGDSIGGVFVYQTADFAGYGEHENRLEALQTLLDERPELADFEALHTEDVNANALPFIPVYAAGQVIRARTQYIETENVAGIAYLTIYQQAIEPFERALWTFQGASSDGAHYISVIFNVSSVVFPADASDFDPERFNEYRAKMVAWLNEAEPESFQPALPALEALVESITFAE